VKNAWLQPGSALIPCMSWKKILRSLAQAGISERSV